MNDDRIADDQKAIKKKLTDWEKEPTIEDLKADLMECESPHTAQTQKIETWLNSLNIEGASKPPERKGYSQIQPKLIKKQAEWRYAPLSDPFLADEDMFDVHPVSWEDTKAAEQNQTMLNYQFRTQIDRVRFIDDFVQACVQDGTAIVKTGWEFAEEDYEEEIPVVEYSIDPSQAPMYERMDELEQTNPTAYMQETERDEIREAHNLWKQDGQARAIRVTGSQTVTKTRTTRNRPTLEVCHHDDVYLDPTAMGRPEDMQFVIHRFQSSLSTLKKDGRYSNLDAIEFENANPLGEPDNGPDNGGSFNFADRARKKLIVHEYWGYRDIDGSGMVRPIVGAWVGNTLIRMEENPFPDKRPPFVVVAYRPVRRSLYGEPDAELLEDNQKIAGALTRGMIDLMGRSANAQQGIAKGALDVTNRRKFARGEDYEYNPGTNPANTFFMHKFPEIPASAQVLLQMQNQEAESLTGVKAFASGISGNDLGENVPAVRGVLDASSKREMAILRRLKNGMLEIGRKIIAMNGEFLSEREVVRVTNDEFIQINREDLAGNFDLRLSISTAEADESKAKELSFMLQTMGNNMDPSMSQMILADIAKLRKMPELAKRIAEYQPQPDPMAQELQKLELEMKKAEVAKAMAEVEEMRAETELKMAKARDLGSKADLTDLDYVEQSSGVKQERELQRVGEQAKSQAQLKAVDHEYKMKEKQAAAKSPAKSE